MSTGSVRERRLLLHMLGLFVNKGRPFRNSFRATRGSVKDNALARMAKTGLVSVRYSPPGTPYNSYQATAEGFALVGVEPNDMSRVSS